MVEKDNIIDLVQSEDGTYSPKNMPVKVKRKQNQNQNKNKKSNGADEFFYGMDVGLDFVENVAKRVNRICKLRN